MIEDYGNFSIREQTLFESRPFLTNITNPQSADMTASGPPAKLYNFFSPSCAFAASILFVSPSWYRGHFVIRQTV